MFRIPRPDEEGIYNVGILKGERISEVSFSNIETDTFNILTESGKLFVISFAGEGHLVGAVLDLTAGNETLH